MLMTTQSMCFSIILGCRCELYFQVSLLNLIFLTYNQVIYMHQVRLFVYIRKFKFKMNEKVVK